MPNSVCFFKHTLNLWKRLETDVRNIYNHQFWCEYMSVHNTILCNLFVFKKNPQNIFLKEQKQKRKTRQSV